jgi:transposase
VVAPLSPEKLRRELARCQDPEDLRLPATVRQFVGDQVMALDQLDARLASFAAVIAAQAQQSEMTQRLQTIAGVGPTTAAAMVATVGDANDFRNGRQFAAWLGLTSRQHSTGGKTRLGRITKRDDAYLRTLLILGARSTNFEARILYEWSAGIGRIDLFHPTLINAAKINNPPMFATIARMHDIFERSDKAVWRFIN